MTDSRPPATPPSSPLGCPSRNVTPEPGKRTHLPDVPDNEEENRTLEHDTLGSVSDADLKAFFNPFHVRFILTNTGSVARDHLSLERTFLSYVRTSLAISSAGVALVQLFASSQVKSDGVKFPRHLVRPLGSVMVIYGLIVLGIGTFRYFRVQYTLTHGYFPTSLHGMIGLSFAIGALTTVVFGILMSGKT